MYAVRSSVPAFVVAAALVAGLGCGSGAAPGGSEADPEQAAGKSEPAVPQIVGREGDVPEPLRERMRAASMDLMGSLKSKLVQELQAGGPASAVHVCSQVAQQIADEHSSESMHVRRVSLKVRNPKDEPDPWEADRLEALHERHADEDLPDEQFFVVEQEGRRYARYLKPITIQKPCLNCHGPEDQLSGEVKAKLAELYPQDEATGYQLGDLRGAVSVRAELR
jgi:hypothetical protein